MALAYNIAKRFERLESSPNEARVIREETASGAVFERLTAEADALKAQLFRRELLDDVKLSESQGRALDACLKERSPLLLLGEPGTGKALLAYLSHGPLGEGPFIRLDAREIPEPVLAIELFGDEETSGRLVAAFGGALFIEGADRLTPICSMI